MKEKGFLRPHMKMDVMDVRIEQEAGRYLITEFEQVLDYLFYEIRFEKRVPVRRVSDLNFLDEEERKI